MNLELKHLAPYLPYGLKIKGFDVTVNGRIIDLMVKHGVDRYTPILRPLSDLTKEIDHNGEKFVPADFFEIGDDFNESLEYDTGNIKLLRNFEDLSKNVFVSDVNFLPYVVVEKLISWHFDVFGLIDNGLAIDINKLDAISLD